MTRKALGRGLNALLREVETASVGLQEVQVDLIDPNPFQPRRAFPESSLRELADSIRQGGVVQPVLLRRTNDRYQLVAGERRWRASRLAGLEKIPALVREFSDRDTLEVALTENLLREDLNPIDVAHGLDSLQKKFQTSHEAMAERFGVHRSTITNTLRLLRLPSAIQDRVGSGEISPGHARALVALEDPESQEQLVRLVLQRGLSVRQLETMVARRQGRPLRSKTVSSARNEDPNTRAAVVELERILGTRVKIVGTPRRGRIEIRYYSAEDLNRLFDWIIRR